MKYILLSAVIFLAIACNSETETALDNTLTDSEKQDGWKLLFDGKTAEGWRGFQQDTLPSGWKVDSGMLKASGAGGDIGGDIVYGTEPYEYFELVFDWKIGLAGNSGVMYHVSEDTQYKAPYYTGPEYQLIDDIGYPDSLESWQTVGADYAMYPPPADKKLKPAGEWNHSRILFTSEKAVYSLNGEVTASFVPLNDDWNAKRNSGKWDAFPDYGKYKNGLISLQDHGSEIWFKNLKILKK
jgi:hypothetical protein